MAYGVSNSEEVERAVATARKQTVDTTMRDGTVETYPIAAFRRGVSDTLVAALDELQAKIDEQQVENNRLRRRCWSWIDEARMWRQSEHACDEQYTRLYADYEQQAAYIEQLEEQLERSFSQMMRQLDEAEAESNHG